MVAFPYIEIINNAPAPIVVFFGMAHAAMAWIVYYYAKYFYRKIVGSAVTKSLLWKANVNEGTADAGTDAVNAGEDAYFSSLNKVQKANKEAIAAELRAEVAELQAGDKSNLNKSNLKKQWDRLMQESPAAHVVKVLVFVFCWIVIDLTKWCYI